MEQGPLVGFGKEASGSSAKISTMSSGKGFRRGWHGQVASERQRSALVRVGVIPLQRMRLFFNQHGQAPSQARAEKLVHATRA